MKPDPPASPSSSEPERDTPPPALVGSTLAVTNLAKVVGIAVFFNEAVIAGTGRVQVIAGCVLFVMGIHEFEKIALRAIDRIFQK